MNEYIAIKSGIIRRTDERNFTDDEADEVIDTMYDFLERAGYELHLTYRVEIDGYGKKDAE